MAGEARRRVEQDMEEALATRIGAPYTARKVTFHLPDFIDIVFNAGDDRNAIGATHRREPAELGPGRERGARAHGRDEQPLHRSRQPRDPRASRRESLLDGRRRMAAYGDVADAGPARRRSSTRRRTTSAPRTSTSSTARPTARRSAAPLASMLEELKAQTGALYFLELRAQAKGIIDDELGEADVRRRHRLGVRPHLARHVHGDGRAQAVQPARGDPGRAS